MREDIDARIRDCFEALQVIIPVRVYAVHTPDSPRVSDHIECDAVKTRVCKSARLIRSDKPGVCDYDQIGLLLDPSDGFSHGCCRDFPARIAPARYEHANGATSRDAACDLL